MKPKPTYAWALKDKKTGRIGVWSVARSRFETPLENIYEVVKVKLVEVKK